MTTVVATGFGLFGEHRINSSWEAVKLLPNYANNGLKFVIEEIPVTYKDVAERVPFLWDTYKPSLVVHVGLMSSGSNVTLEMEANRKGYGKPDCLGQNHPTGHCCKSKKGKDKIETDIDISKICDIINSEDSEVKVCVSRNAGRYLCEFIYYHSLNIDASKTLFVHVPPLNQPYSAEQLADTLFKIIQLALEQQNYICNDVAVNKI